MEDKSKHVEPLNVCLVAEEFPDETGWGGIGTYHYNLAKGLESLGCQVVVIARALENETVVKDGNITVYRIKPCYEENDFLAETIGYRLAVARKIIQVTKEHNINIIESPEWKAETAFYETLNLEVPIALRMHSTISVIKRINDIGQLISAQEVQEYLEYKLLNEADFVSSSSVSLIDLVKEYGTVSREVIPIINPANNVDFQPKEPPEKLRSQFNTFNEIVLYVGRIEKRKGVDLIFKSIPSIVESHPETGFVFIGRDTPTKNSSSYKEELLSGLDKKYHDHISFLGFVPYLELVDYYALADVCILPSYYENFPAVCLEAMSCGRAVIGSKNGGMSEMIEHETSGLLFDPYLEGDLTNKIKVFLSDVAFREKVAENARKRIDSTFDRIKVAQILLEKYHEVIRSKNN